MNINTSFCKNELIISVAGRLDTITHSEFEETAYRSLSSKDMDTVTNAVLDFSELEYISSAGLRAILKLQKDLDKRKIPLTVANSNELVSEILSITGLNQIVKVD